MRDGTAMGQDGDVELDEVAAFLVPEGAHARPPRERVTHAGATKMTDDAPDVDPRADDDVPAQTAIADVREKGGMKAPPGVLMSGTRDAFAKAAASVKARALGKNLKVPG